jgi:hypothetical protein
LAQPAPTRGRRKTHLKNPLKKTAKKRPGHSPIHREVHKEREEQERKLNNQRFQGPMDGLSRDGRMAAEAVVMMTVIGNNLVSSVSLNLSASLSFKGMNNGNLVSLFVDDGIKSPT